MSLSGTAYPAASSPPAAMLLGRAQTAQWITEKDNQHEQRDTSGDERHKADWWDVIKHKK
jgi:hypothetical protein